MGAESTAVQIDVDVGPFVPVFLGHAFQQVDCDHLRLDAVETHIPAEFNSDTELGLEDGQLVVYWNSELGQTAGGMGLFKRNVKGSIDANRPEHSVRKSTEVLTQL